MPDLTLDSPGDNPNAGISTLRRAIDEVDEKIMDLINRRLALAQLIGRIKQQSGISLTDRRREKEIIKRLLHKNPGPLSNDGLRKIFSAIIAEGRNVQEKDRAPK